MTMPKLLFLFVITGLCLGCSPKKLTQEELLIGKWRDENSVVEYFPDGTKIGIYDSGLRTKGTWTLENNIVEFTLSGSDRVQSSRHRIFKLDKDELVLEDISTRLVYTAKRVIDGGHLELQPVSNKKAE